MHTYSFELPMWSAYMGWKIIESVDDLVISHLILACFGLISIKKIVLILIVSEESELKLSIFTVLERKKIMGPPPFGGGAHDGCAPPLDPQVYGFKIKVQKGSF